MLSDKYFSNISFSLFMDYGIREALQPHLEVDLPTTQECQQQSVEYESICRYTFR